MTIREREVGGSAMSASRHIVPAPSFEHRCTEKKEAIVNVFFKFLEDGKSSLSDSLLAPSALSWSSMHGLRAK